jgi:hypothetical protein
MLSLRNRTPHSHIPSNQDDQLHDLHQIRTVDRQRAGLFDDMAGEISLWVRVFYISAYKSTRPGQYS